MPLRDPPALTDPTATQYDGGQRRAFARLRYPGRVILCSPSRGAVCHLTAFPGEGLDLRTSRPVLPGSRLLLLFRDGPPLLAYAAGAVRQDDGSWRVLCRRAGATEAPCAAQPA